MSFSSNIKTEILKNMSNEKNKELLDAESFGELLTQVNMKSYLKEHYDKFLDISKLNEELIKSILKGAFLGSGCIVSPKTDYHFELSFKNKACAEYMLNLLSVLEFTPKMLKRNKLNNYIIYIKDSEQISLFLSLIGTSKSLLEFENVRVEKNVKNNINRTINCETANLSKTIEASYKQLEAIKKLKKANKFNCLNEKLKYTASLREKYKNESLDFIAAKSSGENKISKSGLKHRLDKLISLANELEE